MIAFWAGITVGTVGGFGLAALLTGRKFADLEAAKEHWECLAHRQTLARIYADLERHAPPKDVGAQMLDDIAESLERARWAEYEGHGG